MQRRFAKLAGLAVLAIVLAAAGGYAVYWYSAASQVRAAIERWAEDRRAAGWSVDLGEIEIAGFPRRIDVGLAAPRIAGPGAPPRWRWAPPAVSASARPWRPGHVVFAAPGNHRIHHAGREAVVHAAMAEGELIADRERIVHAVVRLGDIATVLPDGNAATAESLIVRVVAGERIAAAGGGRPAAETGIAIDARSLALPAEWQAPLGDGPDRIALDAVVTGRVVPDGTLPEILARWRDAGGTLEIRALAVDWKALRFRAGGTFALDRDLQPEGAMTAEIDGVDPTADALIAAGIIDERTAFAVKVANRALRLGGGETRLPVTVQQRQLFLGPVPLVRLKPVVWE